MTILTTPPTESTVDIPTLYARCRRLGVTQDQIAAACNVTRNTVCLVLNGKRASKRVVAMAQQMADWKERTPRR